MLVPISRIRSKHRQIFSSPSLYFRVIHMISHNHFKQPIRAFVLDMFDIQLDGYLLEKIHTTEHLLRRISVQTADGQDTGQQAQKRPASQPNTSAGRPPLPTDHPGGSSHRNSNDPSVRIRQPLVPIARQQGFTSQQERSTQEFLFT